MKSTRPAPGGKSKVPRQDSRLKSRTAIALGKPKVRRQDGDMKPGSTIAGGKPKAHRQSRDMKPTAEFADGTHSVCQSIASAHRERSIAIKSGIMLGNRLVATIAQVIGYHAGRDKKSRDKLFSDARKIVKSLSSLSEAPASVGKITPGMREQTHSLSSAVDKFSDLADGLGKEMVRLAKELPVAEWVGDKNQRGFGLLSLAQVIGETGDLSLYSAPGKAWKRLGLMPFNGKMPSTWRKHKGQGGLTAKQWTEIGYNPRRRSICYVLGENLVKLNGKGPYRKRYDEAKKSGKKDHPDWTDGHAHKHGMLLAVKLLIRDLWIEWNRITGANLIRDPSIKP
jgi:hypothetical protein